MTTTLDTPATQTGMGRAEIDAFINRNTYRDSDCPGSRLVAATALAGLALVQKLEAEMGAIDASIALAGLELLGRIVDDCCDSPENRMNVFDLTAFDIECYVDHNECWVMRDDVPVAA
jgi:hypothetical protein